MKITNQTRSNCKIIRRKYKLISPPRISLHMTICAYSTLNCPHYRSSHCTNLTILIFCFIYKINQLLSYQHLFRIHFMFRKIFHIYFTEISQTNVKKLYSIPLISIRFKSSLLKCNPAAGATTAPSFFAKIF